MEESRNLSSLLGVNMDSWIHGFTDTSKLWAWAGGWMSYSMKSLPPL